MNYYSVIKNNGLWIHATTWMNFQRIMQSEKKIQPQKINAVWFHLHDILEMTKF